MSRNASPRPSGTFAATIRRGRSGHGCPASPSTNVAIGHVAALFAGSSTCRQLERIWQAIAELPRSLKEPLILRTIEGLSQSEAAAVLRISEKAVETRVYRARRKLASFREGRDGPVNGGD